MATATKSITADELFEMGDIGRCELVQGELIMMSPAGIWHGVVAMRIGRFLAAFVDQNDIGIVLAAETGYKFASNPDTVRAPDCSVILKHRLNNAITPKFFDGVPDLAVEVTSPNDTKKEVIEKTNMWLANGTKVVWVADPTTSTLSIHRVGVPAEVLRAGDTICDEPMLPGFTLPIDSIFKTP